MFVIFPLHIIPIGTLGFLLFLLYFFFNCAYFGILYGQQSKTSIAQGNMFAAVHMTINTLNPFNPLEVATCASFQFRRWFLTHLSVIM